MESEEFRLRAREVIHFIVEYISTISKRPILHKSHKGLLKEVLPDAAPTKPESFDKIMNDVKNSVLPGLVHWRHPRYFAYFPCGGSFPSILADMLISTINCVGFSWAAGPACTELEIITLDWLAKMIGLPAEFQCSEGKRGGGGVFQVSSADAMLVNMIAARHLKIKEMIRRNPCIDKRAHLSFFVAYCSKSAHATIENIVEVAMVQVRFLETDDKCRLRGETLAEAMKLDKQKGLIPFFVLASMGSTSYCSCDVLKEIGPVCEEFEVWLHVDASYAGSALICPEFKHFLKGIEYAHSFTTDPSMWMLINFDCCAMWIKDRDKLTEALIIDPLYLAHDFSHISIDYRHWGIPLSRKFRALKLWFVIRIYGIEGLQEHIRKHIRLAKLFEKLVREDDRFSVENEVNFGIVCFRLKGCNNLNVKLLKEVNDSGDIFLVGTMIGTDYVLRLCICSENTEEEDVRFAWKLISETTERVLSDKTYNDDASNPTVPSPE